MRKIFIALILMMIGMASFADSWFTILDVQHRKFSMDEESTCIFLCNSKYIVCYELLGNDTGLEDLIKRSVRFKYLDELPTGGKDSVRSSFALIRVLKNSGLRDSRIWIIPRKGDNKWKLYSGENRITF